MNIDVKKLEQLITQVVKQFMDEYTMLVPVGVSNRHVHVRQEELDVLFGVGYQLTKIKDLKQPGQYAAQEVVELIGPKGCLGKVRILGPVRKQTQVEISKADSYVLGIDCPVKESGDLTGTPGLVLRGPQGEVTLSQGVIVALRHIHMSTSYAMQQGYHDGQIVSVKAEEGARKTTFHDVKIRVADNFVLEMHLDVEEANAAGLSNHSFVNIISN